MVLAQGVTCKATFAFPNGSFARIIARISSGTSSEVLPRLTDCISAVGRAEFRSGVFFMVSASEALKNDHVSKGHVVTKKESYRTATSLFVWRLLKS